MTDDTTDTTPMDDQFPTDSSADFGERTGTGKTARVAEAMAAVSDHDEMEPEWFDPKGDPDAQNLDVSSLNPLDMLDESLDESREPTGSETE